MNVFCCCSKIIVSHSYIIFDTAARLVAHQTNAAAAAAASAHVLVLSESRSYRQLGGVPIADDQSARLAGIGWLEADAPSVVLSALLSLAAIIVICVRDMGKIVLVKICKQASTWHNEIAPNR